MTVAFSRRGFLATSAPIAAVTVAGVAMPTTSHASSAFGALALRLDEAEVAYRKAATEHAQARARLFAMAPTKAPDALLIPPRPRVGEYICGEIEMTPDMKVVVPNRRISTVHNLEIEVQDYGPRTVLGREVRKRLPIARAYEAAMEHAREASGYNSAETARFWAALALMRLADEAFKLTAENMADVAIKARSLLSGGHSDESAPMQLGIRHGQALAADVARLMGGAS